MVYLYKDINLLRVPQEMYCQNEFKIFLFLYVSSIEMNDNR